MSKSTMEYLAEEAEQFTVHTNLTVDAALEMAFNDYKPKERKVAQKMMTNALEEDFCAQHEFNGFTMNVEEDEVAFWVDWDTAGITAFVTWLTARLETAEIPLSAKNHEAYVGKSKTERNLIYVLRSDITEDLEVDLGKMGFDDPADVGAMGFTGFAPVEADEEESDDSVDADGDDMEDDGDDNDDNHEEKGMKSNKEKNVGSGVAIDASLAERLEKFLGEWDEFKERAYDGGGDDDGDEETPRAELERNIRLMDFGDKVPETWLNRLLDVLEGFKPAQLKKLVKQLEEENGGGEEKPEEEKEKRVNTQSATASRARRRDIEEALDGVGELEGIKKVRALKRIVKDAESYAEDYPRSEIAPKLVKRAKSALTRATKALEA